MWMLSILKIIQFPLRNYMISNQQRIVYSNCTFTCFSSHFQLPTPLIHANLIGETINPKPPPKIKTLTRCRKFSLKFVVNGVILLVILSHPLLRTSIQQHVFHAILVIIINPHKLMFLLPLLLHQPLSFFTAALPTMSLPTLQTSHFTIPMMVRMKLL